MTDRDRLRSGTAPADDESEPDYRKLADRVMSARGIGSVSEEDVTVIDDGAHGWPPAKR